jgi:hypothetical protein
MALVETGQVGTFRISPGVPVDMGGGQEVKPGHWFRFAVSVDSDNPPGAWIQITGESVDLQDNGTNTCSITMENNYFAQPVAITVSWLSVE